MNFTDFDLDPKLLAAVSRMGYTKPTPIQEQAIPAALAGRDIIATAQTGTGKTAAFVLPMLQRLSQGKLKRARALVVTPTRELAEQVHGQVEALAGRTRIRSATIYGGVKPGPQVKALKAGVEVLVACPGRLLDHINSGAVDLSGIEVLILDEADRMLDMGFLPDIRRILKHIPERRQTMLFSATFPREIEDLARSTLHQPERIAIGLVKPAHTVSHALFPVAAHLKTKLLMALLEETPTESVLIFTRTKHRAKRLAQQLERTGLSVTSLHGNRTQGQRRTAIDGFQAGRYQIMVATDVAARGIDVRSISHVINFDMPTTADDYIHRIGRTGRAEKAGDAFTFITTDDEVMVKKLERIMDEKLSHLTLPGFDYDAKAPPRQPQQPRDRTRRTPHHKPGPFHAPKPAHRGEVPTASQKRPRRGKPHHAAGSATGQGRQEGRRERGRRDATRGRARRRNPRTD